MKRGGRGRGGSGRRRGSGRGRARGASAASASFGRRKPWDDSDDDDVRPDFLSDSNAGSESESSSDDDLAARRRRRRTAGGVVGLEDEADDAVALSDDDFEPDDDDDYEEEARASTSAARRAAAVAARAPTPDDKRLPCPPWLDRPDALPPLHLPPSSADLPMANELLFKTLDVYEICRRFGQSLQLSPFLFEDFCAALLAEEQSRLLFEVHVAFLKLLIREDDQNQIIYGPWDLRDSQNISQHLVDPMTYAEVLRQYVDSDRYRFPAAVRAALSNCNYPFVSVERRLVVLKWLADKFVRSAAFRRQVRAEGAIEHDEHCRDCGKSVRNRTAKCTKCSAVYHLECTAAETTTAQKSHWLCCVCQVHRVRGVFDCISAAENDRTLIRQQPIGYDRHGRRYWFLVRRIFVEDDRSGDVRYYSTIGQLWQLVRVLDDDELEWPLCALLREILTEIVYQMATTFEVTEAKCAPKRSYLREVSVRSLKERLALNEGGDLRLDDMAADGLLRLVDREWQTWANEDAQMKRIAAAVWPSAAGANAPMANGLDAQSSELTEQAVNGMYRLGGEPAVGYQKYTNQYSTNDYAKTPYARAEDAKRNKYLANRFALADEALFSWPEVSDDSVGSGEAAPSVKPATFGEPQTTMETLRHAINRLSSRLPLTLLHRRWNREGQPALRGSLEAASTPEQFGKQLAVLESCIRRCALSNTWRESLGHTRLHRTTVDDKEWKKRVDARNKRRLQALMSADPNDDADAHIVWVKYTRYGGPPTHQLWKMKDEQYRMNGENSFGGWIWVSCLRRARHRPVPERPLLNGRAEPVIEPAWKRKAERLSKVLEKLKTKRSESEVMSTRERQRKAQVQCFSPSCRRGEKLLPVVGPTSSTQRCYSAECRRRLLVAESTPSPRGRCRALPLVVSKVSADLGKDLAYPLPDVHEFIGRRSQRRSLIALPPTDLKRMARQGALRDVWVSGFNCNSSAKSNQSVWPYPCPRPLFQTCWRFATLSARSFHAVALQLRVLYANIKWADIFLDSPKEKKSLEERNESRAIEFHQEFAPNGLTATYYVRTRTMPTAEDMMELDEPDDDDDYYKQSGRTPRGNSQRSLRPAPATTKKFDAMPKTQPVPTFKSEWLSESELKLWELRLYWADDFRRRRAAAAGDLSYAVSNSSSATPKRPFMEANRLTPRHQIRDTAHELMRREVTARRSGLSPMAMRPTEPPRAFQMIRTTPNGQRVAVTGITVSRAARPSHLQAADAPQQRFVQTAGMRLPVIPIRSGVMSGRQQIVGGRVQAVQPMLVVRPIPAGSQPVTLGARRVVRLLPRGALSSPMNSVGAADVTGEVTVRSREPVQPPSRVHPAIMRRPQLPLAMRQPGVRLVGAVAAAPTLVPMQPLSPPPTGGGEGGEEDEVDVTDRSTPGADYDQLDASAQFGDDGVKEWDALQQEKQLAEMGVRRQGRPSAVLTNSFGYGRAAPSQKQSQQHSQQTPFRGGVRVSTYRVGTSPYDDSLVPPPLPYSNRSPDTARVAFTPTLRDDDRDRRQRQLVQQRRDNRFAAEQKRELLLERRRMADCKAVMKDLIKEVIKWDKASGNARKWTREWRRAYDRNYRKKRAMLRATDQALADRMAFLKREISKRRYTLEKSVRLECGMEPMNTRRQRGAAALPVRHGGKRPLSDRLIRPLPPPTMPPPAKKARVDDETASTHGDWPPARSLFEDDNDDEKMEPRPSSSSSGASSDAPPPPPRADVKPSGGAIGPHRNQLADPSALHCVCQTPYDQKQFYIGCDLCSNWFHGKCVGMSEKRSRRLVGWVCDECKLERDGTADELYCYCRTAYDELQFYVGCDGCEGWYHPRCVGITQQEAEVIEEYVCPSCVSEADANHTLTRSDYPRLWNLFESLQEHRTSWPFREPVDPERVPNYYAVIKEPMDLSTVQKKLERLEYQRMQDFVSDIGHIFNNARYFNPRDSPVYQCAVILEQRFRENLRQVRSEMARLLRAPPTVDEPLAHGVPFGADDSRDDDDDELNAVVVDSSVDDALLIDDFDVV